jgi:CheY-like chemotaxis protein
MKAVLMVAALPGNREVVARLLAEKGWPCLTAGRVAEIEAQLNAPQEIACAVVDPSGFTADLLRVCRRIIEQKIPVYWILPAAPRQFGPAPPAGVSGVWHKPVAMPLFLDAIRACLNPS